MTCPPSGLVYGGQVTRRRARDRRSDLQRHFVDETSGQDPNLQFLPRHIPSYFRLDLQAEYELWDDRAAITVGVRNLLDSSHPGASSGSTDTGQVPRMVYAELRVRLD